MQIQRRRSFELRLSKAGVALFTVGVSFLLLISFVLGVIVGKNIETYPEKITRAIPGLIREKITAMPVTPDVAVKPEDVRAAPKDGKEDVKLTFFDNLAEKKEAKEDFPQSVPEEKPAITKKPSKQEKSDLKTNFILRVASLKDEKKAKGLQKKLATMSYRSTLETRDLGSKGKFYRVNITGFDTREDAENAAKIVKKKINLKCVVAKGK